MKILLDMARIGLLWTGAQHADLARPLHPMVARRLASADDLDCAHVFVATLVDREAAFHTPTLLRKSYGFERITSSMLCPIGYRDETSFDRMLALLIACDFVVEVPEAELLPLAGYLGRPPGPVLPRREYWGKGARGFRVTDRGYRFAAVPRPWRPS